MPVPNIPGTLLGVDVSKYQAPSDWTPYAKDINFIGIRATIGTEVDVNWDNHYAWARKLGVPVIAYHFSYDGLTPAESADKFLKVAANADAWAIDVEGANGFN